MKKDNLYTWNWKLQPGDGFAGFNQCRASSKKEALAKAKVTELEIMGDVYIQLQEIAKLHMKANATKPKLKVVEKKETK